jgi:GNAT superfamily N-acetyltransferase
MFLSNGILRDRHRGSRACLYRDAATPPVGWRRVKSAIPHTPSIREALKGGLTIPDKTGRPIVYRYVLATDDLDELTVLLHEAYAPLAARGMRFVASYQDRDETAQRMARGETVVATEADQVVGLVTLADAAKTGGSSFYDRPDVASFGQFAVKPSHQKQGIGTMLMELVERRADEQGVASVGVDTSEHATELVQMYEARGYSFREYVQWKRTNYRSVILGKPLR